MKNGLTALFLLICFSTFAQSPVAKRVTSGADMGYAFRKDHYNPSLTYYQLLNIGERRLISLGWTAKLGAFYGDNLNYITAPARLSRGETGFGALSAPLINENIDTVRFDWVSTTALNLGVRAQVNLGIVQLGASADLVGIGFGGRRTGRYISSNGEFISGQDADGEPIISPFSQNIYQQATVPRFNLQLLGDNSYGTLSTEVYGRVRLGQRLLLKAGAQWLMTEVRTDAVNLVDNNRRFRNTSGTMVYLGLTFPFFY